MSILETKGFILSDEPASLWQVMQLILYVATEYKSFPSVTVTQIVEDSHVLIAWPWH